MICLGRASHVRLYPIVNIEVMADVNQVDSERSPMWVDIGRGSQTEVARGFVRPSLNLELLVSNSSSLLISGVRPYIVYFISLILLSRYRAEYSYMYSITNKVFSACYCRKVYDQTSQIWHDIPMGKGNEHKPIGLW